MAAPIEELNLFPSIVFSIKLMFLCLLFISSVSYFVLAYNLMPFSFRSRASHKPKISKTIVFVIAHPDDECMFFSPAITHLVENNTVNIVCITSGDYYKQGHIRKVEILQSCEALGIKSNYVEVLDDRAFPDDPNAIWDTEKLLRDLNEIILRIHPDYIFTFDKFGVSGHPNHTAVSKVVRYLVEAHDMPPKVYELESVSLWRKYISFLDLPASLWAQHQLIYVSSLFKIVQAQRAMYAHYSQFVWFRILYIIFSRYMVINTFVEVEAQHPKHW